jgi:sporulation protein YlmC with PRC-barrel domain
MFRLFVNKKTICSAVAALALLFVVLPVRAEQWLPYPYTSYTGPIQQGSSDKITGRVGDLQDLKGLLYANIKNDADEKLGFVKELILDEERGDLSYVVIESGGTFHPVPWSAFSVTPNSIKLNINKSRFMSSPQTGPAYIDKLSSPTFRKDVEKFYSEQTAAKMNVIEKGIHVALEAMIPAENPELRTFSDVTGLKVRNMQGESLASVRTLFIDTREGNIAYTLISFGGFLGFGEKTAAVPWNSLTIEPSENVAYLDADRATLETALVDEANPVKLTQPSFAKSVDETFGENSYWQTLGFVPPESKKVSLDAWRAGSEYNKYFNPKDITTISGVIRSVGIFTPDWNAAPGLKLVVETGKGELVVIHGGPQSYALQRVIDFKPDMRVTVTGSKVGIGGESVIMATEIKTSDKTLVLRDNMGAPKWNVDEIQREMENALRSDYERQRQMIMYR